MQIHFFFTSTNSTLSLKAEGVLSSVSAHFLCSITPQRQSEWEMFQKFLWMPWQLETMEGKNYYQPQCQNRGQIHPNGTTIPYLVHYFCLKPYGPWSKGTLDKSALLKGIWCNLGCNWQHACEIYFLIWQGKTNQSHKCISFTIRFIDCIEKVGLIWHYAFYIRYNIFNIQCTKPR
jgi:hypothetical protein